MNLSVLIQRIRSKCPVFANRVGGAFEFSAARMPGVDVPVPHAFCVPLGKAFDEPEADDDLAQQVTEVFGVIVCIGRAEAPLAYRCAVAEDLLTVVEDELRNALCSWSPTNASRQCWLQSGDVLAADEKRLWYQLSFAYSYYQGVDLVDEDEQEYPPPATLYVRRGGTPKETLDYATDGVEFPDDPTEQELEEYQDGAEEVSAHELPDGYDTETDPEDVENSSIIDPANQEDGGVVPTNLDTDFVHGSRLDDE